MLGISYLARDKDFAGVTGASNLEASYHVLLTLEALKASPAESHRFLPIVTLGDKLDKNIPWGGAVPTANGDYIYTSFTPPGFLAPYLTFQVLHVEATEKNLARFNFVLGSFVSLLLYGLLFKMLQTTDSSREVAVGGAMLGTLVSIFSREVIQSHGIVYWSHSLYQLILISSLYFLFAHLTNELNNKKRNSAVYLLVAVFFGAWTEWTGYVFGIGLAVLFWFGALGVPSQRLLSLKLVLALIAAGLFTLLHYGFVVGFESAVHAFATRFLARSTSSGNLISLLSGYVLSFGLFIVVAFSTATISFFGENGNKDALLDKRVVFLFMAASIPVIENFIMLQHASQFSFDRLKLIFPLAIITAIAFARYATAGRLALFISLVFASIHGYKAYGNDLSDYSVWAQIDLKNRNLAKSLSQVADIKCSVLMSNVRVRGYANLLFNRGIYEGGRKEVSAALLSKSRPCSVIYIDGVRVFPDLPYYRSVSVTKLDGSGSLLEAFAIESVGTNFFLTDSNWAGGVARHWAGFFVPNTDRVRAQLSGEKSVIFRDGEMRKITAVRPSGEYLNVYVDGDILKLSDVGPPSSYSILRTLSAPSPDHP